MLIKEYAVFSLNKNETVMYFCLANANLWCVTHLLSLASFVKKKKKKLYIRKKKMQWKSIEQKKNYIKKNTPLNNAKQENHRCHRKNNMRKKAFVSFSQKQMTLDQRQRRKKIKELLYLTLIIKQRILEIATAFTIYFFY